MWVGSQISDNVELMPVSIKYIHLFYYLNNFNQIFANYDIAIIIICSYFIKDHRVIRMSIFSGLMLVKGFVGENIDAQNSKIFFCLIKKKVQRIFFFFFSE